MADQEQKLFSGEQERELQERLAIEDRVNPFSYDDNFTLWEFTKCVLGIVVVPIRTIIALSALLLLGLCAVLSTSCGFDDTKPMSGCRKIFLWPVRPLTRVFLFAFGFYTIKVKGRRDPRASVVIGAPHSTFVDVWVVASQIGVYSGMGKKEVLKVPIFGSFMRASQIVAVDRFTPTGRKDALDEFVRRVHDHAWGQMLVFPEGTCTNRKSIIQFKRGAFVPGAPVQPILLRWPHRYFDPTWTSSSNRKLQIFRLMTQIYNNVEVEFLEPYIPNEAEINDSQLFAENVRQVVAENLQVPMTEHSYEDSFLSMAAHKNNFKPDSILSFDFATMKKLFQVDLDEAKRLMNVFGSDPKVKKTGELNVEQFAKALGLPLSSSVVEFFGLLDQDGSGVIDFRTFLIGLTFISEDATSVDNGVELIYHHLDPENTGRITRKKLQEVLSSIFRDVNKKTTKNLFERADPDNTGYVDKEALKAFLNANPEYVVLGMKIGSLFETRKEEGRKLTVFTPSEAESELGRLHAEV